MEKHFITALLVLMLLAPQTGLEAKSRHHGVKDRDHDAEERDHEDKKRYHKAKKHHHKAKKHHHRAHNKHRHLRAIKAKLKSLKRAVSEINTKMEELESQGAQIPAELVDNLAALEMAVVANQKAIANQTAIGTNQTDIGANQMAIDTNQKAIDGNYNEIGKIYEQIVLINSSISNLDTRITDLEQAGQPGSGPSESELVFSGHFISKKTPDAQLVQDWLEFRRTIGMHLGLPIIAVDHYTSIEIRGSAGGGVSCSDPVTATEIANALNSEQTAEFNCENRVWNVGAGQPRTGNGGIELNAGSIAGTGNCSQEASVRPLMGNSNWGGIGLTCVAPSQTLEVILTLKNTVL